VKVEVQRLKLMEGEKLSKVLHHLHRTLYFDSNLGRATCGEMLILWAGGGGGATLGRNFDIDIWRAA
jgi:hypothetical protein